LNADATGTLEVPSRIDPAGPRLDLDIVLSDVQLKLPRLTFYAKPPQILLDKRFAKTNKGAAAPFAYAVRVHTANDGALRLLTNLAKAPVPLALDFQAASSAPFQGLLAVGHVPLQLFRRDAAVDHFLVHFAPQAIGLDGKLRVVYADYTVFVYVLGTAKAPIVKFVSDPPLPDQQLGAILLFGKDMAELDANQLSSSDDMRAAAADGALSLASLYLLASTPVESVGYDPQAKAFTAKVALAPGLSLNLGSDFEDYQKVGLRKRIAGPWAVDTSVERRPGSDTQSVTAMLEWSRRY
jgi:hypothetical protein